MHPNKMFRSPASQTNIGFARARSFGTLVALRNAQPLISHVPFQLSENGEYLEAHLAISNPIVRKLDSELEATMIVSGADAYISPDWYEVEEQVPTWNYVAVHLSGTMRLLEEKELKGILERLSKNLEERLLPKVPWKLDKLSDETLKKLSRQIIPIAMDIRDVSGTWKLSQNKSDEARLRAASAMEGSDIGNEINALSALMKEVL